MPTRGGEIPGALLPSGPADAAHAGPDSRRASRRHQRVAPRRPRGRSRGHRIRRADGRGARPAAIQDHAAGHRHDRGRGEVDQRAAAVPHRRQDRHRRHQFFRRPLDRRRGPRLDPRSRGVRDVVRRPRRSVAGDALPHHRAKCSAISRRPSAAPRCSARITSACIRRTTTALAVTLLNLADRVVPADQVGAAVKRHRRIPARVVAGGHRSAEGDPGVRGDEEIPGDASRAVAHLHAIRERSRGRQARTNPARRSPTR